MATAQDSIDEVRRIIHDEVTSNYRWTDAELLDYLNAGLRQTVALIPEANTIEAIGDTLTSRVARQSLPTGGIKFIKVARNYADDGITPQGVLRYVEKDALDTYEPDWEFVSIKVDGADYFDHFCHDPREPKIFFLYPAPAADNKRFAVIFSSNPTELTLVADTIPVADEYLNALILYCVYRALTKESRAALPDALRQELWSNYLTALGLKVEAEEKISPETLRNRPPEGA